MFFFWDMPTCLVFPGNKTTSRWASISPKAQTKIAAVKPVKGRWGSSGVELQFHRNWIDQDGGQKKKRIISDINSKDTDELLNQQSFLESRGSRWRPPNLHTWFPTMSLIRGNFCWPPWWVRFVSSNSVSLNAGLVSELTSLGHFRIVGSILIFI